MSSIIFKVDGKIPKELDLIQEEEGLGNRTSTFTFLIKYYFLSSLRGTRETRLLALALCARVRALRKFLMSTDIIGGRRRT